MDLVLPESHQAAGIHGDIRQKSGARFSETASCGSQHSERKVKWFHGSPTFAHFIEVGKEIDLDSIAYRAYEGKTLPNEMEEVPAEAWIKSYWLKEDATVSEQAISMSFYNGCLGLIWVRRPIEDRPSAEDELLKEFSPDEFTLGRKRWPR